MDLYIGMGIGVALAILFFVLLGMFIEQYFIERPFRNITVSDFQEGG